MKEKYTFKELSGIIIGYANPTVRKKDWSNVTIYSKDRYFRRVSMRAPITFGMFTQIIKHNLFNTYKTLTIERHVLYKYQEIMTLLDKDYINKIAKRLSRAILQKDRTELFNTQPGYLACNYHNIKKYYREKNTV